MASLEVGVGAAATVPELPPWAMKRVQKAIGESGPRSKVAAFCYLAQNYRFGD